MLTSKLGIIIGVMLALGRVSAAFASTDDDERVLVMIQQTADKICNVVSENGDAGSTEVKGEVKAQLNGLVARLADLGVSGTAGVTGEHYQGVLRRDLANTLTQ